MEIEARVFASYVPIKEKLEEYGFSLFGDVYAYEVDFMDDAFNARILIDARGQVEGKVIEKEFDEEYYPLRNESYHGSFVGDVRMAYERILLDIRDHCFIGKTFISAQANRIAKAIGERHGEYPDFPFVNSKIEHYGVFRYPPNKKWYALVMNVKRSAFKGSEGEFVDIVNLKIDESKRDEILSIPGIYPSYHMDKKKWVSILLDETIDDETILSLVDTSRSLIIGKKR